MKKRVLSLLTAVIMMITIFAVPVTSSAATTTSISKATVTISQSSYSFTKKEIKPVVTVKLNGKKLTKGTDYTVTYSNNIYPGTAKITVKGKGKYSGTKTKTFGIATPNGIYWKSSTTSSIKIDWAARNNVTGYCVYKYDPAKKVWKWVKNASISEATISNLSPGLGYQFKIRSYYKKNGKVYYSPMSAVISIPTKPSKFTTFSVLNHPAYAKISWAKKTCTGYQVKLSRYSDFSKSTTYTVKSSTALSKQISGLADGTKYYVTVRAYRTYGKFTTYGAWSNYKVFTPDKTRWYTTNNKQYYYTNGKKAYGKWKLGGNQYYFNSSTGELAGASSTMWNKVKDSSSKTKYLIAVSRELNRICVYTGSKGNWTLKYYWKCSTGAPTGSSISKTPTGSWLMPETETHLGYIGGHKTYTCWYATRFYNRCFFHSVLYQPASKTDIQDGRLGMNISDGCIRMDLENAKWIYDNCHGGTRVIVY